MDQHDQQDSKVTMLRVDAGCPDIDTCPGFALHADDPEGGYVIITDVTDPAILADFAPHIGPGERLGRMRRHLAPEVFDQ